MNKEIAKLKDAVKHLCEKVQQQEKVISFLSQHQYNDVIVRDKYAFGECRCLPCMEYLNNNNIVVLYLSGTTSIFDYKLIKNNEDVAVFELKDQYCILNKGKEAYSLCPKDIFDINKITK